MTELTPADTQGGVATVDARSLAIPQRPVAVEPVHGTGATPSPYVSTGLDWRTDPRADPIANRFEATLRGAVAVRLDARRMRLDLKRRITGRVCSDRPLELRLSGRWVGKAQPVVIDGADAAATVGRRGLVLRLPAGRHVVEIAARGRPRRPRARRRSPQQHPLPARRGPRRTNRKRRAHGAAARGRELTAASRHRTDDDRLRRTRADDRGAAADRPAVHAQDDRAATALRGAAADTQSAA
jgi:hypothetical protein